MYVVVLDCYKNEYDENERITFTDYKEMKKFIYNNFLDWFFEQEVIKDADTFIEVMDFLEFVEKASSITASDLWYEDVFYVEEK